MRPVLDLVAGARPNFIKLAPVFRALRRNGRVDLRIVHTCQHFDPNMSDVFFAELGIPKATFSLELGQCSPDEQTARISERYEELLAATRPTGVVVFGDVNSTLACANASTTLGVPVAHVEAGLRSFDRTMPEEINRVQTDAIADLLLVSEPSGVANLLREGVDEDTIRLVGNVMIDTLNHEMERARSEKTLSDLGLNEGCYGLVTMHRPSNVDSPDTMRRLLELMHELSERIPLVFPVHPRTRAAAREAGIIEFVQTRGGFRCIDPVSYRANLALMASARVVLTDSGGMQEETSVLRVPCLTLRENTERPVTVDLGTNRLVGTDSQAIRAAFSDAVAGRWRSGRAIPVWDGRASERIVPEIIRWLCGEDAG